MALPTEAYCSVEIVSSEGNIIKNFVHIPSTVEAFEPEEVGVEHLLREIKDISFRKEEILTKKGVDFVNAEALSVDTVAQVVLTDKGEFKYDNLEFIFLY